MVNDASKSEIAGGVRSMTTRWVITGEMVLKTAAHFGGDGHGTADMSVLRDPKEGAPLLPGTSLGGALRSHLADVLGGYRSMEHSDVSLLFGAGRAIDEGCQSPLIVFDSLGKLPYEMAVEIRDGVAIDPATGTAEAHKKFDFEVLPAGTVFPVRVDLIVGNTSLEDRLLGLLAKALEGLRDDGIALGMRRSRGLGRIATQNWRAKRFDLTSRDGWLNWVTSDHLNPVGDHTSSYNCPWEALAASHSSCNRKNIEDKRKRLLIDLDLELAGDLLVRSPGTDLKAPDVVHLPSAGRPVLPGTSLAGTLRAHALRIAWLVLEQKGYADEWVAQLFGPRFDGSRSFEDVAPSASRLLVSESFINGGSTRCQTRIAIDRFTGGVVKGALFDEEVQSGGKLKVRLELRNPTEGETGLLLLVVKDLLSGDLPVGGSTSVGRGVIKGTARLSFPDGKEVHVASELAVEADDEAFLNRMISAFHKEKRYEDEPN